MNLIIAVIASLVVLIAFTLLLRRGKSTENTEEPRRRAPLFVSPLETNPVDANKILGLDEEPAQVLVKKNTQAPQVVTVNLIAKEGEFVGYELLQALLSNGLRFGKMKIFHREGLFSLASMIKPGTFDMQKMGSFSTRGLTLFAVLNDVDDPLKAFDSMLETAYALMEDLGGELLNAQREPLDNAEISKMRKQVKAFIENQEVGDLFEMA